MAEWNNTENNDGMDFDKTVSAFSGMPPFQKNQNTVSPTLETPATEMEEEDDFDRTVSAFSEPRYVKKEEAATKKNGSSYWSTTQGKVVKYVCILLPMLGLGLLLGPFAIVIWIIAFALVFGILK